MSDEVRSNDDDERPTLAPNMIIFLVSLEADTDACAQFMLQIVSRVGEAMQLPEDARSQNTIACKGFLLSRSTDGLPSSNTHSTAVVVVFPPCPRGRIPSLLPNVPEILHAMQRKRKKSKAQ